LDKDLAADMNDMSIFVFGMSMMTKNNKLENYFNSSFSPWKVAEDDKGVTLTTSEQFASFGLTVPRRAMSKFVTDVDKNGLSIDGIADLVAATPKSEASMFVVGFACVPFPGSSRTVMMNGGESVLRAYALLDQGDRTKAKQGGFTAQFRTLTPALQRAVENFVFFEAETSSPVPIDLEGGSSQAVRTSDVDQDTTSVFPNGMQPDTLVTFRIKESPSLFTLTTYGQGPAMTEAATEDYAAQRIAMAETYGQLNGTGQTVKLAQGTLKQLDMAIVLASKMGVQDRYQLLPSFKPGDVKDVDQLPDDVKKGLKEKLEKQREMYKNMPIRQAPNKIKP